MIAEKKKRAVTNHFLMKNARRHDVVDNDQKTVNS